MSKLNFCYRISEDAQMATTDDGEDWKAYIKASIDTENSYTESEIKHLHDVIMLRNIANQLGIEETFFTPISYEEYLRDADDE